MEGEAMRTSQGRKPSYSGYVNHMLNFYIQSPHIEFFRSDVDRNNWVACDRVYSRLNALERSVLYLTHGNNAEAGRARVQNFADQKGISVQDIWKIEHRIQYKVAVERGLVAPK